MMRALLYICLVAFAASCHKGDDAAAEEFDGVIRFTSDISTRVDGNKWEADDEIGINITPDGDSSYTTVENELFSTDGSGVFTSETALYYPTSGSVNIFSYYPWLEDVDLTAYEIVSSEQKDLLKATATASNNTTTVALDFDHMLSKVSVTIRYSDGAEVVDGTLNSVSISGVDCLATFNLKDETVDLDEEALDTVELGAEDESASVYSAIVIPQTLTEFTLTVVTTAGTFDVTLDRSDGFVLGTSYSYTNVTLPSAVQKPASSAAQNTPLTRSLPLDKGVAWSDNTTHDTEFVLRAQ